MAYVYPVISRRAGGVSIGINLNPNNACNWQCVYCQVPGLIRGSPPPIDLSLLRKELDEFLGEATSGSFMQVRVPVESRRLVDVAFSGNGEPTSAAEFADAVAVVADVLSLRSTTANLKLRLITNGSLIGRGYVQEGLQRMAVANGEVWFKLDSATAHGIFAGNGVRASPEAALRRLRTCAGLCSTWVQSCFFSRDGKAPSQGEIDAYIKAVASVANVVQGVHLYGLARPSMQPGAERLARLSADWFGSLAEQLKNQGLTATVSP
jgi:hypothetical protein